MRGLQWIDWGVIAGSLIGLALGLLKPVFHIPFIFAWVIPYSCVITFLLAYAFSFFEKTNPA